MILLLCNWRQILLRCSERKFLDGLIFSFTCPSMCFDLFIFVLRLMLSLHFSLADLSTKDAQCQLNHVPMNNFTN